MYTYSFRKICNHKDLDRFFILRKEEYLKGPYAPWINTKPTDLDIFDLHSQHYGIYQGESIAGYLRIIMPDTAYFSSEALHVAHNYGFFHEIKTQSDLGKIEKFKFHFDFTHGWDDDVRLILANSHSNNIVEPSRIMAFKPYKNIGLSRFITECALVIYIAVCIQKNRNAFITCAKNHSGFYQKYGFELIKNIPYKYPIDLQSAFLVLKGTKSLEDSPIPTHLHPTIRDMAEEFSQTRQITREL